MNPAFLEAAFFTIVFRRCILPNIRNAATLPKKSISDLRLLAYFSKFIGMFALLQLLLLFVYFRHDRCSGEPYNFSRAKIVSIIQILKIWCVKTFSTQSECVLSVFWDVCMSVRPYVIKFSDYLNDFSTDSIEIAGKYSSNYILVLVPNWDRSMKNWTNASTKKHFKKSIFEYNV